MKGSLPPVSDADLLGFVDGETDPALRDRILGHLAASPIDAARVETWRRQNETIRAAFARIVTEPLPFSLSLPTLGGRRNGLSCKLFSLRGPDTEPRPPEADVRVDPPSKARQAALIGVAFASGILLTLGSIQLADHLTAQRTELAPGENHPSRRADVGEPFVDRTISALSSVAPRSREAQETLSGAPADFGGTALIVPNLSGAGLRLAEVRVSSSGTSPSFCLFYATALHAKVALCIEKADTDGTSDFRIGDSAAPRTIAWRQKGAKYAFAGALAENELHRLAERAYAEVEGFDRR